MIRITNKKDCCGCSACSQSCPKCCIKMQADEEGFLYPVVDTEKCIHCNLCDKVCPIINRMPEIEKPQKAYVVQIKDEKVLKESTSGGAFTAIAESVIDQAGVVFGASFTNDFRVIHTYAGKKADLVKFRNSKYVQSDTGCTFTQAKELLDDGLPVCYSGTPCQIEGLKRFLGKDYGNLITVDVVCHAVPSPLIWEKYKKFIAGNQPVQYAAFRDKEPYGYEYSQITVKANETWYRAGVESDAYLRAFFSNICDRPSCYSCVFKKRYRVSDITLWDCFNIYQFSETLDNNRGATKVLIHSSEGEKLFAAAQDRLKVVEVTSDKLVEDVKEMFSSVPYNPLRDSFLADAATMEDVPFFHKYFPDTVRVKGERFIRLACEKLGIYSTAKRMAKKLLKKR